MIDDYSVVLFRGQYPSSYDFADIMFLHKQPGNPDLIIYDPVIEEDENVSGTLTFKVPNTNPNVKNIVCGSLIEMVDESKKSILWFGRLLSVYSDMYGNLTCTVEGPMVFLKEHFMSSVYSPEGDSGDSFRDYLDKVMHFFYDDPFTLPGYVESSRDIPNPNTIYYGQPCTQFKRWFFTSDPNMHDLGNMLYTLEDFRMTQSYAVCYNSSNPINLYDFITKYVHLGIEELDGKPYGSTFTQMRVDIIPPDDFEFKEKPRTSGLMLAIESYDPTSMVKLDTQLIEFGENMLNAEVNYDFTDVGTVLMVLGAEYTDSNGITKRYTVTGNTDNYYGGDYAGDYLTPFVLSSNNSIEKYGYIPKTVIVDTIKTSRDAGYWANVHRNDFSNPIVSFTINAVDLSVINPAFSEIKLGNYFMVYFPGLNEESNFRYRCSGRKINVFDPTKSEFTFSYTQSMNMSSLRSKQETTLANLKKSVKKSENIVKSLEQKITKYEQEEENNG